MAEPREPSPQDILLDGLADRIAYRGRGMHLWDCGQVGSLHYVLGCGEDPRPWGHWGSHIPKGFFLQETLLTPPTLPFSQA